MDVKLSEEELMWKIDEVCPEMKSNKYLMISAKRVFCDIPTPRCRRRVLTNAEYQIYEKLSCEIRDAKVGDLIDYLKQKFKPDDKVCYIDCVEGVKNDCTYVRKTQLGDRFFRCADPKEYPEGNAVVMI